MDKNTHIVLFDGICNLCNSAVTFIIQRDKNDIFKFAALQSDVGLQLADKHNIDTSKTDSIILIENDRSHTKSSAVLRVARHLSGAYPLLYGVMILPKFIRNWMYDIIADNRYKWFGKRDSCMVPTPELKEKFLDG